MGLLKADKDTEAGVLPDEKFLAAMGAFMEEGVKSGVFLSGEGLRPSSHGAWVRYSGSQRMVTDGPFAETKELIAGYAMLQFTSRAEAIEWTKRFVQVDAPGRLGGECECEIRPFFEYEDFGPSEAVERFRQDGSGDEEVTFTLAAQAIQGGNDNILSTRGSMSPVILSPAAQVPLLFRPPRVWPVAAGRGGLIFSLSWRSEPSQKTKAAPFQLGGPPKPSGDLLIPRPGSGRWRDVPKV